MALVDLGCGPASITAGLAAAVAPGHTVGVDLAPARAAGATVAIAAADAASLPFEDESFDALYACALLQHVADPSSIVREARRVARPGAVIALADADWDGVLLAPADPLLERSTAIQLALRDGGSPRVGKQLRGLLADAGFVRATAGVDSAVQGDADAVRANGTFQSSFFSAPAVVAHLEHLGLAAPDECAAIAAAWLRWSEDPRAFWAGFWCTAVAWVDT
jgi:SAM-dependent methyltransferase